MSTVTASTLPRRLDAGPRIAPRTPADRVDRPYTRLSLSPTNPTIGAFVEGVGTAM